MRRGEGKLTIAAIGTVCYAAFTARNAFWQAERDLQLGCRHFDVIDMRYPVPEAYELVKGGCITPDNFRDLVFAYTVPLRGTQNPKFLTARRWPRRPPGWRADSSS